MAASVAIVDDHALLAEVLARGLRAAGYDVRVLVPTPAVDRDIEACGADVVLLDLELGDGLPSGIEVAGRLVARGTRPVMLTGVADEVALGRSLLAGAAGIIRKQENFDTLLAEVRAAIDGDGIAPGRNEAERLKAVARAEPERQADESPFPELSGREAAVLDGLVQGLTADDIALRSFVAVSTVRSQIKSLRRKLGVRSQLAAVALAVQHGWIPGSIDPA